MDKTVSSDTFSAQGATTHSFDISTLSNGTYMITTSDGNTVLKTTTFNKE